MHIGQINLITDVGLLIESELDFPNGCKIENKTIKTQILVGITFNIDIQIFNI